MKRKFIARRILAFVLSLGMVFGSIPGADDPYTVLAAEPEEEAGDTQEGVTDKSDEAVAEDTVDEGDEAAVEDTAFEGDEGVPEELLDNALSRKGMSIGGKVLDGDWFHIRRRCACW